jgi:cytolysin (calcineurin-like family phosphatase)
MEVNKLIDWLRKAIKSIIEYNKNYRKYNKTNTQIDSYNSI